MPQNCGSRHYNVVSGPGIPANTVRLLIRSLVVRSMSEVLIISSNSEKKEMAVGSTHSCVTSQEALVIGFLQSRGSF